MGFGFGFEIFHVLFSIAFAAILIVFILSAIRGLMEWNHNNHSPRLTVPATVISKRINVTHHQHTAAGNTGAVHTSTSTSYYVTFQVDSGDRMELCVKGSEYGMLAEGDVGQLSFQGTRYLSFERNRY